MILDSSPVSYEHAARMSNGRLIPGQQLIKDGKIFTVKPNSGSKKPRNVRTSIPARLRHRVLKRDRGTCRYCGTYDSSMEIDHVIPVALGGTNRFGNLVTACRDCNARKGTKLWKPLPLAIALTIRGGFDFGS